MKKLLALLLMLTVLFSLAACDADDESIIATVAPTEEPAAVPADSAEPQQVGPQPGYYLISSVGDNGDVTFYSTADPDNGYLKLEEEHTGVMCFGGEEKELTWDEEYLYWGEETLPCIGMSYYDPELEQEDFLLAVYLLDDGISIAFRAVEQSGETGSTAVD